MSHQEHLEALMLVVMSMPLWEICRRRSYEEHDLSKVLDNFGLLALARRGAESTLGKLNQKRTNINKGLAFVAVYLLSLSLCISILRTLPQTTHSHFPGV
jgi:hypothetical protein